MPIGPLTDVKIRALEPPQSGQVTYWDEGLSGFGVRVSTGGTKAFVLVHGANRRRTTIGRYPALSLKEARAEAKRLLAERTLGIERGRREISFAEARQRFLDGCAQKNRPRTISDYRQRIDRHFKFGRKPLGEITRADIKARLDRLVATPSEQTHAFVALRTFFNWAQREELVETSPMANMRAPAVLAARERVLSDAELAEVYRSACSHAWPFGPIVQLLLLTGQRRGETAALRWEWINEDERVIALPASITKNKRAHAFPYGERVNQLLVGLPRIGDYVFPARTTSGTVFNGWGKSKARFDRGLEGVEPYTLHDLRRTFSSTMARLGTPIHVTEKLLNHVSGTISGVAAVYNRHGYLEEMRQAIDAYDTHIANLING